MKFIQTLIIAATVWLFQSCFDSNEYIFDEDDAIDIKIDATLSHAMSAPVPSVKADTFNIHDTIFLLAIVSPNKIFHIQDYYWLMDGVHCSSDYNLKKQIDKPGHHKFTFVLKDHFEDIHSDSLDVWVADNPILNDSAFIPAQGTQAIDPYETIYFTWSAKTEGIRLAHHFHFTLNEEDFVYLGPRSESKFIPIDTILNEPYFEYHNELNPLKKYNWTVQAFNEYNLASLEKIESFFYTKGLVGEGSIQAKISTNQQATIPIHISLQNKTDESKVLNYNLSVTQASNEISLGSIPVGAYQITFRSDFPDFKSINKDIDIHDGFITILDNIQLTDSIAPSIASISNLDTLEFSDTLKFIVKDGSGTLNTQSTTVHLESDLITDRFYKDSILNVILRDSDKSWTYRILTISVSDGSNNSTRKTFYIKQSPLWFTTNSDTTIAKNGSILLYIKDNNLFGFKVETLQFYNVTKNESIVAISNTEKTSFSAELEASLFDEEQTIESIIIYTNGMKQSKSWKLYVKDSNTKGGN